MQWFIAKIVFQIICGDGKHTPQFDEQIRLIRANDEGEAYTRAIDLGYAETDNFYNKKHELVKWQFIDVSALHGLLLIEGAELFSQINEVEHTNDYIDLVRKKSEQIRQKHSHQLLQPL